MEFAFIVASLLLGLAIVGSKVSGRIGVPTLVLFLVIGMLAGSDGPGGIKFNDATLAQSVSMVALVFILFAGGLDTSWRDVRPVLGRGMVLSTLAVALTGLFVALPARWLLGMSWEMAALLGAIVSSTDAAAVFSILRSRNLSLKGSLRPLLEFESGCNDPMAVFLTISVIALIQTPGENPWHLTLVLVQQMSIGLVFGYLLGRGAVLLIRGLRLEIEGLYPVLTMGVAFFIFGLTSVLAGSGFMAVYVAGIVIGNEQFIRKQTILRFNQSLSWLGQIVLFLVLGLLVNPRDLLPVAGSAFLLAAALVFLARPLAVFISLLPFRVPFREQLFIGWVGLRGAVPIVLATFPLVAGIPGAMQLFNVVFFVVIVSVLVQGTTIPVIAKWLRVSAPGRRRVAAPLEFEPSGDLMNELVELEIHDESSAIGKKIKNIGFPAGTLVTLIGREGKFIVPNGESVIVPGDTILVLAERELLPQIAERIADGAPSPAAAPVKPRRRAPRKKQAGK